MQKILLLTLVLAMAAGFTACKKGEEDPFISLRSRDGRIASEWTLNQVTYTKKTTEINQPAVGNTKNIAVTTKEYIINRDGTGTLNEKVEEGASLNNLTETSTNSISLKGQLTLAINEDGSYSTSDSVAFIKNGDQKIYKNRVQGNWSWGNTDQNKTHIKLSTDAETGDAEQSQNDFSEAILLGDFTIVGLSNTDLMIEKRSVSNNFDYSGSAGSNEKRYEEVVIADFTK